MDADALIAETTYGVREKISDEVNHFRRRITIVWELETFLQ